MRGLTLAVSLGLAACAPAAAERPSRAGTRATPAGQAGAPAKPVAALERARAELERSDYDRAEASFRAATRGSHAGLAWAGLSEVLLLTGRYDEAVQSALSASAAEPSLRARASYFAGEALRRMGKLGEAEALLRKIAEEPSRPDARRSRLLLAEILLERGRRGDAVPVLMTLIEDYNADRITKSDALGLALVGRAAHLLRSPHDANEAFNEAELAKKGDPQTLLYRAELFLEKYDPAHAEEVMRELLARAPRHAEANVWLAHVRLAQALDFNEAERLARLALAVNPKLAGAHAVLAGIALRDLELDKADRHCEDGLRHNPRNLELLSMKAAVRFLAEDASGFERAKRSVLELNPEYSRLYEIVGDYADWEHRYDEIVVMMREALRIDAEDPKAYAQLGLNLVRAGNEREGVSALQSAFERDPFNPRVFNTLELFEKTIPEQYVSVPGKRFNIRYHKDEKAVLERYVPDLLDQAWRKMVKTYGFEPSTPVGIELYAERRNFAVRTSGLPHTAIQGVCFGKTLAAMSLREESFNLGMTLWHELSHVFHIQLSKSRVPRWFTEGLAEYETLAERPEWAREQDPDLYEALRTHNLPQVAAMNRAFTRAEQMSDVATAYYASSQIARMMVESYGLPKLSRMLALWGAGKPTPEVIESALGTTASGLDAQFRADVTRRLGRYGAQFVPMSRVGALPAARAAAEKARKDARAQVAYALALLREGDAEHAEGQLNRALELDPKLPDARFLKARLELGRKRASAALAELSALVQAGHDGFAVQMLIADALAGGDQASRKRALARAHTLDPTQSEPLTALVDIARKEQDLAAELDYLRKLAALEQHEPVIYRRLLRALLDRKLYAEAVQVGESAVYADLSGAETHTLFAEALAANKLVPRAIYELETALLCPGRPQHKAEIHAQLAQTQLLAGNRQAAAKHARLARELDPENPRVKRLQL